VSALRVVIVDDEQPARNRLRELLDDCKEEVPHVCVGEAQNGMLALELLGELSCDLVLVDIHMPGMNGIEFARHLQLLESPPAVIFVTAHDQYAVDAFELNAVDYLLKPPRTARLVSALRKVAAGTRVTGEVLARLDTQPRRYFSVAERGRVVLVPVADAIYLKAEQKYVTLRTRDREFLIEESLTQLEQEFSGLFCRIHRNCLIARRWFRGVERVAEETSEAGWLVVLEGCAEKLPVSRRQWPQLKSLVKS
jgi:two-component system response regulator AlgR